MPPALAGLGDFHTYDLARVTTAMVEAAEAHPQAPAVQALRGACTRYLTVDPFYRTPWADPTFLPRYLYLRNAIVTEALAGERATTVDAIPVLDAITLEAVRLEQSFDQE